MSSYDSKWEDIPKRVEECGKEVIDGKEIQSIGKDLKMDDMTMKKCMNSPYTTLLQYTKGDDKAKVTTGAINAALDSYRHISYKGKGATVQAHMLRRVRVMNPEPAKHISDIEAEVNIWKHVMRLLTEARLEQDIAMSKNDDQIITIFVSMMPDPVADHLVEKYDVGVSTLEEIIVFPVF